MKEKIGQKQAWVDIHNAIIPNLKRGGGEFIVILGEPGIGKSHLVTEMHEEITAECGDFAFSAQWDSCQDLCVTEPPKGVERPADGMEIDKLVEVLDRTNYERVFLFLDECHDLPKAGSAAFRPWGGLIMPSGQGWNGTGSYMHRGETHTFNRANLVLVMATNFPKRILGGNYSAIARRASVIRLQKYTDAEMRKLVPAYMEFHGMQFADEAESADSRKVRAQIAKVHRGTFAALDAFRKKVDIKNITLQTAQDALHSIDWTLRGFTWQEIKVLKVLKERAAWMKKGDVKGKVTGGQEIDWPSFIEYAQAQRILTKDGLLKRIPFIECDGNSMAITSDGVKFLNVNADWLATE